MMSIISITMTEYSIITSNTLSAIELIQIVFGLGTLIAGAFAIGSIPNLTTSKTLSILFTTFFLILSIVFVLIPIFIRIPCD